jgi:hypothetical protein
MFEEMVARPLRPAVRVGLIAFLELNQDDYPSFFTAVANNSPSSRSTSAFNTPFECSADQRPAIIREVMRSRSLYLYPAGSCYQTCARLAGGELAFRHPMIATRTAPNRAPPIAGKTLQGEGLNHHAIGRAAIVQKPDETPPHRHAGDKALGAVDRIERRTGRRTWRRAARPNGSP